MSHLVDSNVFLRSVVLTVESSSDSAEGIARPPEGPEGPARFLRFLDPPNRLRLLRDLMGVVDVVDVNQVSTGGNREWGRVMAILVIVVGMVVESNLLAS